MRTRRAPLGTGSLLALAGCLTDAGNDIESAGAGPSLSSPAFTGGTSIPTRYTRDGADVSPPLRLAGTPDVESLAVVLEDPDAPSADPFVHWLLWNVPPDAEADPEGIEPGSTVEDLDPGADAGAFRSTVDSHVTGAATITGTYDR